MSLAYRTMSVLLCLALVFGVTAGLIGCEKKKVHPCPPSGVSAQSTCPMSGTAVCPQTNRQVNAQQPCPHMTSSGYRGPTTQPTR